MSALRASAGRRLARAPLAFFAVLLLPISSMAVFETAYAATPPPWELSHFVLEGGIRVEADWAWGEGEPAELLDALGAEPGFSLEPKLLLNAVGSLPGSTEMHLSYDEDEAADERLDLRVTAPRYTLRGGLYAADLGLPHESDLDRASPLTEDVFLPSGRRWSGVSGSGSAGGWQVAGYAGRSMTRPAVDEFPGEGHPGPYSLPSLPDEHTSIADGSARVEVAGRVAVPGVDYFLDEGRGKLYFTYPVAAGTPIRVMYEYEVHAPQIGLGLRTRYERERWQVGVAHFQERVGAVPDGTPDDGPHSQPLSVWHATAALRPHPAHPEWTVGVEGAMAEPSSASLSGMSSAATSSTPSGVRVMTGWSGRSLRAGLEWLRTDRGFPAVYSPVSAGAERWRGVLDWRPGPHFEAWARGRLVQGGDADGPPDAASTSGYRAGVALMGSPASLDTARLELELRREGAGSVLLAGLSGRRGGWDAGLYTAVPSPGNGKVDKEGREGGAPFSLRMSHRGASGTYVSGIVERGVLWGAGTVRDAPAHIQVEGSDRWRLSTTVGGDLGGAWRGRVRLWGATVDAAAGSTRLEGASLMERLQPYWDVTLSRPVTLAGKGSGEDAARTGAAALDIRWSGGLPTPWAPQGEQRLFIGVPVGRSDRVWGEFERGAYRRLDEEDLEEDWGKDGWGAGEWGDADWREHDWADDESRSDADGDDGGAEVRLTPLRTYRIGTDLGGKGWSYHPSIELEYRGEPYIVGSTDGGSSASVGAPPHWTLAQEFDYGPVRIGYRITVPPQRGDSPAGRPDQRASLRFGYNWGEEGAARELEADLAWSDQSGEWYGWDGTAWTGGLALRVGGIGPLSLTTDFDFERRYRPGSGSGEAVEGEILAERLDRTAVGLTWQAAEDRTIGLAYRWVSGRSLAGAAGGTDGTGESRIQGALWRLQATLHF